MLGEWMFYRCGVCGRIAEVSGGSGKLFCHGRPMIPMKFKGEGDEGAELHEPSIFNEEGGIYIEIGVVPHEMTEDSRIMWIEVVDLERGLRERKYLDSSKEPSASFDKPVGDFEVRLLCSRHGLWRFPFKLAGEDLITAVKKAIKRFNSFRSPEAKAELLELRNGLLRVEFTGNFCRTCGFYDYFEDLRLIMGDEGIKAETVEIDEFEDGAIVIYRLGADFGDRGSDKGDKQAEEK